MTKNEHFNAESPISKYQMVYGTAVGCRGIYSTYLVHYVFIYIILCILRVFRNNPTRPRANVEGPEPEGPEPEIAWK